MPEYRNRFASPEFIQETILDERGGRIGVIRVKPSSIKWRPKGEHKYYSVPLDRFTEWIMSPSSGAQRTSS
jgi:hypothetical protein